MRSIRPVLAAVLFTGALLLVLPSGLEAKPRATQQPRKGQRVVNPVVQQQQANIRLMLIKKKVHHPSIHGTVVSVHRNKQVKGTGTIKLAVTRHHHKRNNVQVAGNAVKVVKQPCQRQAMAIGQKKKRHTNTVTIHYGRTTRFALTVRGPVQGTKTVTVGSGKNKAKVVVPGKVKIETRNLPIGSHRVEKGHQLRITLHDHNHHSATAVHVIHVSAMAQK
jgi:hypothetical protein